MTWREEIINAAPPNGGVLAIVQRDPAVGTCVITEYDANALTVYRFEYQRVEPGMDGDRGELTITDWDGQLVEEREIVDGGFPPELIGAERLAEFVVIRHP